MTISLDRVGAVFRNGFETLAEAVRQIGHSRRVPVVREHPAESRNSIWSRFKHALICCRPDQNPETDQEISSKRIVLTPAKTATENLRDLASTEMVEKQKEDWVAGATGDPRRLATSNAISEKDVSSIETKGARLTDESSKMSSAQKIEAVLTEVIEDEGEVGKLIAEYQLTEDERHELGRKLGAEDYELLAEKIDELDLPDKRKSVLICDTVTAARKFPKVIERIDEFNIKDHVLLTDIYVKALGNTIFNRKTNSGDLSENFGQATTKFFSETALREKAFHEIVDRIATHLEAARQPFEKLLETLISPLGEKDGRAKDIIGTWWCYAALRLKHSGIDEKPDVLKALEAIGHWRIPAGRYTMTDMFLTRCIDEAGSPTTAFTEITRRFQKTGSSADSPDQPPKQAATLFPLLLAPIFNTGAENENDLLDSLVVMLKQPGLKKSERRHCVINCLSRLAQGETIDNRTKQSLLRAALTKEDGSKLNKNDTARFVDSMMCLEALTAFVETNAEDASNEDIENSVRVELAQAVNSDDIKRCASDLYRRIFPLQGTTDDSKDENKIALYCDKSRQPNALLMHAVKIRDIVNSSDKKLVMKALHCFLDAVCSSDPSAFHKVRYDVAESEHLGMIQTYAPGTYKTWQQSLTSEELDHQVGSKGGASSWKAVDTDDPDHLFLCGTETNSCLSVHFSVSHSKAILGYVLDGKYRMMAITNQNGKIVARRMLRLMWDPTAKKPVVHVEKLYTVPGAPKDAGDILLNMARRKAQLLEWPLVISGHHPEFAPYANSAVSLDSRAPFEFVDSVERVASKKYRLDELRVVP